MPSQIVHTLFGEDVITALCGRLKRGSRCGRFVQAADTLPKQILGDYRGVFALGCQGPDIFYHSQRRRPSALEYGSLLHRRGYGTFTSGLLQTVLSGGEINALGVYALGFMTHAALDRLCHPYIVYRADKDHHAFFERIIDVLMLKALRGQDAASWDQEGILAEVCENPPPGLKKLIAGALAAGFPGRVKTDPGLNRRIDNAFADCAYVYRLTAPSRTSMSAPSAPADRGRYALSLRSLLYVYPENLPADVDFLNLQHAPWYYPYRSAALAPEKDTRSFPEIYAGAVEAALDAFAPCIGQYFDTGIFPAAEAARSIGDGSLSIQDEEGKPAAANFTCPLPLAEVLAEQARIRGISL